MTEAEALLRSGRFVELAGLAGSTPSSCLARLVLGDLDGAESEAHGGLASADGVGSLAGWLEVLLRVALRRGRGRAVVALARRMDALGAADPRLQIMGAVLLGRAFALTGDRATGSVHLQRALRLAESLGDPGDPWVLARAHFAVGWSLADGDHEEARAHLRCAAGHFAHVPYWAARCRMAAPLIGRLTPRESLCLYRKLITPFRLFGDRFQLALAHIGAAEKSRALGEVSAGLEHSLEAERICVPVQLPLALYGQAEAHRMLGQRTLADGLYQRALELESLGPDHRQMLAVPGLGVAARQLDLPAWDTQLRWAARGNASPEALWGAYDECRTTKLGDDRLGQLASLAWQGASKATRKARVEDLHAHRRGGFPCGGLQLIHPIGSGAMATVWEAQDPARPGQGLAVKLLRARQLASPGALNRFAREVRALAALRHPGILPAYDRGTTGAALESISQGEIPEGTPWMLMPLARGGALTRWCGRLPWDEAQRLLRRLLRALAAAHASGVLHLDIKPDNVLLAICGATDSPRLADFGLARAIWESHPSGVAGTPRYMAPEQFRADWRSWGPSTDLYALGCLAVELVSAHTPFSGDLEALKQQHLHQAPPPLEPTYPVPIAFRAWVHTLLEKDPRARFASAAEALAALPPGDAPLDSIPESRTLDGPVVPERWTPAPLGERPHHTLALRRPTVELVGREPEKKLLWAALRRAAVGEPQVVILKANPGLGAMRIARWLGYQLRLNDLGEVVNARFAALPATESRA